jgi:hypothetical protein
MILPRSLLSHAALAAVLGLATPAYAQYGGSGPPPPASAPRGGSGQNASAPAAAPTPATPAELQAGAACVIGRNAAAADAYFATAPFSAEERQQAIAMISEVQRCLRQRHPMATSPSLLRGALAEAVVESRFTAPQAARNPALSATPLYRPDLATTRTDPASMAPVYTMAECTTVQHPELVRALLATTPATPEAGGALQALNPAFVACVPRGSQISIEPGHIRGVLAEDLYRWSVVQRDGAGSPWAAPAVAAGAPPPPPQPH